MAENSIFSVLREDHRNALNLFDKIVETSDNSRKTRERLFTELKNELDAHKRAEEEVLYPFLMEHEETREDAFEALEEHHVADLLIQELSSADPADEQWRAKLSVLRELVSHHIEEEEDEVFEKAAQLLEDDEGEELGARVLEVKKSFHNA